MILDQLEPASVFHYFEEICAIPHGSGRTAALSDFCVRFARARGFETHRDDLGNVVIVAPAAPGYEGAPPVIVQGHLDMVCAAAPGCEKDMTREGLDLFVEGDLIGARGTTLGGDDGIAVAMILALLDDPALPRPRLEAVLTVDEEVGMPGAKALDAAALEGRTMLNLDSEAEGVFTVGCAGGARVRLCRAVQREKTDGLLLRLGVEGLRGGHSGTEIAAGRGNANLLMGKVLGALRTAAPIRLVSLSGGTADNAIPAACTAEIVAEEADAMPLLDAADRLCATLRREFAQSDPGLRLRAESALCADAAALTAADSDALIGLLDRSPNGVQAMSADFPGLPETSLNLGLLALEEAAACITFSVRSSVAAEKRALISRLCELGEAFGAAAEVAGEYPAWEYRADSPLRRRMERIYRARYGAAPRVEVIHAGLECGILAEKLPGLDCVSIGPDIFDIHTPSERLSIPSTARTWEFVKEILKESH